MVSTSLAGFGPHFAGRDLPVTRFGVGPSLCAKCSWTFHLMLNEGGPLYFIEPSVENKDTG